MRPNENGAYPERVTRVTEFSRQVFHQKPRSLPQVVLTKMPKENFHLSDATRDTLEDNVKAMCAGWNKCKTTVYNILDETDADPFPPFLSMYNGALRAGLSTVHWDTELNLAQARNKKHHAEPSVARVHRELFEAVDAMIEGKPADVQKKEIKDAIDILKEKLEGIERIEGRNGLAPVA
jgi:hypothetical protein